ncbi:macro domain-containing protein [Streptomyces cinnamoneus]|uniref:macro domain-containing protein n=1 Tax=Streptomyces cinnamoneus TaxID=53446 RepID=UPI00167E5305|nr:macro domain-containing protein [Streptomyces cinnamoneus]
MNAEVRYVTGDATAPVGSGPRVIAHVCNDTGGWGRGFVTALSQRWRAPEAAYRAWYRERDRPGSDFGLGAVQMVEVGDGLWVANMIGQHGIARPGRKDVPLRYDAVDAALRALARHCIRLGASVHAPRIGCGLAGGSWDRIDPLLQTHLIGQGVPVTVYDIPAAAPAA